jgi:Cdc6-like AAA superfamily ATPase
MVRCRPPPAFQPCPGRRRQYESFKDPQSNRTSYGGETLESQHAAKLRRLVVALQAPAFLPSCHPSQPDPTPSGMNSEQHAAVSRVLAAEDYTLVLGMPGSGKTTTIVSMVQALVAQGKRVLLTSYTNRQAGSRQWFEGWGWRELGCAAFAAFAGFRVHF